MARRYLASAGGNPSKAAHLLTATLIWRAEFITDALHDDHAPGRSAAVARLVPIVLHDRPDRHGHAVKIMRLGFADATQIDVADLYHGESAQLAFLRHHVWLNEAATRGGRQRLAILDLTNLGSHHLQRGPLRVLRATIDIDQRHYPGLLSRVYVVNAGPLLRTVWPLVESWLSAATLERVRVLGRMSEPANRAAILEDIAEADLPPFLGPRAARAEG